jgi:hypothetical protein
MTVASARGRYSSESVRSQQRVPWDGSGDNLLYQFGGKVTRWREFEMRAASTTSRASTRLDPDLQYIPKTPKNPNRPRAISRGRTSLMPKGKCSVFLYHMYTDAHNTVMPIRANKM